MAELRSSLSPRDLVVEAAVAVARRPGRSMLTALGTVVGVGAFVATTGIATTARAQVSERFDGLKATEVRVVDANPDGADPFPLDVDQRLERLNGVNHAGRSWTVPTLDLDVRALPPPSASPSQIPVIAATPGAVDAARPVIATGRLYDDFHDQRAERVAVLGSAAAQQLGINRIDDQPAVFIVDRAYTVVGILADVARDPDLLVSVVIPDRAARRDFGADQAEHTVLVDVDPGAAQLVGSQAALALRPDQPDRLQVLVPPDPRTLRQGIDSDVTGLLYGLAALALLVGMIGIANTTLVAVLERRSEIGLRRALGARRRHITAQFLAESAALGALGGILGTSIGILTVVATSAARHWTTTIDPALTLPAPVIGAATGLIAGLHPALRAARAQPVHALRGD